MAPIPARLPDLELTREALATSTLSHGLQILGDRWTVALILSAFLGVQRFDDFQERLAIPRQTLTQRLTVLTSLGLLEQRPYQQRPRRLAYHLTGKGLALYNQVLMMWVWERRWGSRQFDLPKRLVHRPCGHAFVPELACTACGDKAGLNDFTFSLQVNEALQPVSGARQRGARLTPQEDSQMGLGLRVDRWTILIVAALFLGCHHFDQLTQVLGIGSSVLARRLGGMVESGLLVCQADLIDTRRKVYRLTPASRDLFGYILCLSSWASRHHFLQPSSIQPTHKGCGHAFVPQVVCSHCREPLNPADVTFT
jgi:DNA-binding HxlR family transcriptional regulator